ncbi:MAG: hypothetical protein ACRDQG_14075 [Pseudonocardiaceae bacterium]
MGKFVRNARRDAGYITLSAWSAHMKISEKTLGDLERGKGAGVNTIAAVESELAWEPGSVEVVRAGGDPVMGHDTKVRTRRRSRSDLDVETVESAAALLLTKTDDAAFTKSYTAMRRRYGAPAMRTIMASLRGMQQADAEDRQADAEDRQSDVQ